MSFFCTVKKLSMQT